MATSKLIQLETLTLLTLALHGILTVTLTLAYAHGFGLNGQLYKEYGEVCSPNDKCNPRNLLSCINGQCSCPEPDKILFDATSEKCVARVGRNCGPIHSKVEGKSSVTLDCSEDAVCDEGFCTCAEGYFGSIHGTCVRKRSFGDACYHERECDINYSKALVCQEGICQCDPKVQIFDEERKMCVGLVGSDCNETSYSNECAEHAECRYALCVCQNGFTETSNSTCENDHGQACGTNYPCSDIQLACINGKCQCQLPLHQIYDKRNKECLSLVSGPCTLANQTRDDATESDRESKGMLRIEQKCVKNSECVDKGFYNECKCMAGFVQTTEGQCAPGFGEACEMDECDPITPLYCRNNRCDCYDMFQVYDRSARRCVGLVGSRCSVRDAQCVEFASCVLQPDTLEDGKCLCDKYAQEIENRTCSYPYPS